MNQPHVMIGTAPEASYWLLRSEDEYSEGDPGRNRITGRQPLSSRDGVGVDLVNTSLGYYSFQ